MRLLIILVLFITGCVGPLEYIPTEKRHKAKIQDIGSLIRTETEEVICYSEYNTGLQCFLKNHN